MNKKKTAIIFGVSGQDGAYLSDFLLKKRYKVIGTTRNKSLRNLYRLKKLGIINKIAISKGEATDLQFCKKILNSKINEIYYLAGDSSVTESFKYPENSLKSNALGILNILDIVNNKYNKI